MPVYPGAIHGEPSHAPRILAACAATFCVLIDGLHFEPRCVDQFWKRRATLALRQPASRAFLRHNREGSIDAESASNFKCTV
jgi:hypothetical protein